jgi:mitochondrial splicing suppressor protein 51
MTPSNACRQCLKHFRSSRPSTRCISKQIIPFQPHRWQSTSTTETDSSSDVSNEPLRDRLTKGEPQAPLSSLRYVYGAKYDNIAKNRDPKNPQNSDPAITKLPPVLIPTYSTYSREQEDTPHQRVLFEHDLYHPLSKSPIADLRRKAEFIKSHAYCPHPSHNQTRMPETWNPMDRENAKPRQGGLAPMHSKFECPDCGIPLYCCEEHYVDDYETHIEICDLLRQINEDEHDIRSGRFFPEFEYPSYQIDESFLINMTSWDTYLYTRDYRAINSDRSMRNATRMLTYPMTITSILDELSPYHARPGGRLTYEGLKSFTGRF